MKFIIFLCLTIAALQVQAADPEGEIKIANEFARECEKELGGPKNLMEKIQNGEDIGDKTKAGRMALCINNKAGRIDMDGNINESKLLEHVIKLTDDLALRGKMMDKCGKRNGETPEMAGLNLMTCMFGLLAEDQ